MLFIIQFMGRWGSAVVEKYVGNAFVDVAAGASLGAFSLGSGSAISGRQSALEDEGRFARWWDEAFERLSEHARSWHRKWQAAQDARLGGCTW